MLDRLTSMAVFAKVASLGSFSAAARALAMSQAMASKHVAAIEARLETQLLHRTMRRVTLTEAGRHYLEACLRILGEFETAEASTAAERLQPQGRLRLSAPVSLGMRQLGAPLAAFARAHPRITFELSLIDRFVDLVDEGWDLAIRVGTLKDSSLIARRLAPSRLVVCAAPSYLDAQGMPARVADLQSHSCLIYAVDGDGLRDWWPFGVDGEIRAPVRDRLRSNNGDILLAAAVNGAGLAYLPTFIASDAIRAGRLSIVRLDQPTPRGAAIHAVYPPERNLPAKTRALIDFLAAHFGPRPEWDEGLSLD